VTAEEERAAFDRRHARESVRIAVLTGEQTAGASHMGPDELWTRWVDLLAWVDDHGIHLTERGRLSWTVTEDQRAAGTFDLAPLSQYDVRVRRAAPDPAEYARHGFATVPDLSGSFALDEVLGPSRLPELDDHLRRWLEPVVMRTDLGDLELRRRLRYFGGVVAWGEDQVRVLLDVDEGAAPGAETCDATLGRLREHLAEVEVLDARWRAWAASELLELGRDWQAERDDSIEPPLTEASFARRITLDSVSVMTDGATLLTYDDGGIFLGHVVQVEVGPDGSLLDAQIAG